MTPNEALLRAVIKGNRQKALEAFSAGANPLQRLPGALAGGAAYEAAIRRGDASMFALLMKHQTPERIDCLRFAIRAMEHAQAEILKRLAGQGVMLDRNMDHPRATKERLPISPSEHLEEGLPIATSESLLLAAIRLDAKDNGGRVRAVLAAGASPDWHPKPHHGFGREAPIFRAVFLNHAPSVQALIDYGAKLEAVYGNNDNPRYAIAGKEDWRYTPLAKACTLQPEADRGEVIGLLLEAGAKPDILLHRNYSLLMEVIREKRHGVLRQLLEAGANANIGAPLVEAVLNHDLEAGKLLLAHGADVHGDTIPAICSAISNGEPSPLFIPLVNAGADPFYKPAGVDSAYGLLNHDGRRSVDAMVLRAHEEIRRTAADGTLAERLVKDGKPTEALLSYCALRQLPYLGSAELWKEDAQTGWAAWQAMGKALPRYWRIKMNDVDTVALYHCRENPLQESAQFRLQQERQRLGGEKRR